MLHDSCESRRHPYGKFARKNWEPTSTCIFYQNDLDLSDLDNLGRFVLEANQVRKPNHAKTILVDSQLATNETRKLWESIYFLGRLRSAFEGMTRVLWAFPSFEKIRFIPLSKSNITTHSLHNPPGLEKTLQLLGQNMTATTVKHLLGLSWTIKG